VRRGLASRLGRREGKWWSTTRILFLWICVQLRTYNGLLWFSGFVYSRNCLLIVCEY
jgi:hypothetical protein